MKKMVVAFFSVFFLVNLAAAERVAVVMKCRSPFPVEESFDYGTFVYCENGSALFFPNEEAASRRERTIGLVCHLIFKDQNQFTIDKKDGTQTLYIRNAKGRFVLNGGVIALPDEVE